MSEPVCERCIGRHLCDGECSDYPCPRCWGRSSDRCEQGGQACVECGGKGRVKGPIVPSVWHYPKPEGY